MIRKAMPAQNSLLVRNQTTMATMAAGRKKNSAFTMKMRMMNPNRMRAMETIQPKMVETS